MTRMDTARLLKLCAQARRSVDDVHGLPDSDDQALLYGVSEALEEIEEAIREEHFAPVWQAIGQRP